MIDEAMVENLGQGKAGSSLLQVAGIGPVLFSALIPVPELEAGDNYAAPVRRVIELRERQVALISATADMDNRVTESDEENNARIFTALCQSIGFLNLCTAT